MLSTYFPALERALDVSNTKTALILLTGYRTPDGLRRIGQARLESWLWKRKTYNAAKVAATALEAANAQHVRVQGQDCGAIKSEETEPEEAGDPTIYRGPIGRPIKMSPIPRVVDT